MSSMDTLKGNKSTNMWNSFKHGFIPNYNLSRKVIDNEEYVWGILI